MDIFPRRGVELTTECEMLFPKARQVRPAIVHRYENGSRSARFRTAKPIYYFTITFKGSADNYGIVTDFLGDHGVVVPFQLVHPDYGTGIANLQSQEHEMLKVVSGNPPWFGVEIPVEAVF